MINQVIGKVKLLLKSPMILFIYGLIAKWYMIIMIPAISVTFWILTGLSETGILGEIEKIVVKAVTESKSIARYCTPKILNFSDFWECLNHPPHYEPTEEEKIFEDRAKNLFDLNSYDQKKDPYSE
jgi:hypothetical protein